jgi:hypothetical protein
MRERELRRRITALESEVRELRNLPIGRGLADAGDGEAAGPEE